MSIIKTNIYVLTNSLNSSGGLSIAGFMGSAGFMVRLYLKDLSQLKGLNDFMIYFGTTQFPQHDNSEVFAVYSCHKKK